MSVVRLISAPTVAGCRSETAEALDQHNAPKAIRHAIESTLRGFDIPRQYIDDGALSLPDDVEGMLSAVESCVKNARLAQEVPFLLGGAHTISLGTMRALAQTDPGFSLVYVDAHPDMMPRPDINYGSTIYHALSEKLIEAKRMAFIGTRKIELPEAEVMRQLNIVPIGPLEVEREGTMRALHRILQRTSGPVLLSLDLDSIDPSFAPGVTAPACLGLTPREVAFIAREVCRLTNVAAVELVELSPIRDREHQTANIAAALVLEISKALVDK